MGKDNHKNSAVKSFFRIMVRNKQSLTGMIILTFFILTAMFGPVIFELDMTTSFDNRYLPPSFEHWLGTDYVGRDIFVQLVYGARDVLIIGLLAAIISMVIGFTVGALSGFVGKKVDTVLMFITNLFLTIPSFPIMLILTAFIKISHPLVLAVILSIFSWAGLARAVRAQVLSLKNREFIVVCKVMGLGNAHIIFKEMLPNLVSYLAMNFIGAMQGAIMSSVGLMMMGFAPYSPTHWGTMLNVAITQTAGAFEPKTMLFLFAPIGCFILLQMGCIFFSHGLDEALNPRLRS